MKLYAWRFYNGAGPLYPINMFHRFNHPESEAVYGIFNDSFPPIMDGVTLTVENYASWLDRKGYDSCVVTPWNPLNVEAPFDVMRFFSLPIFSRKPYRYGYPKLDPFIWYRLRHTNFRIVHSHCPFSSGRLAVYAKRKHDIPLIGTFHSKYRDDLMHSFPRAHWMVSIIMKRILDFFNECDEVWIPQAQVEETVREYGYRGPLTVMENGNDFASRVRGDLMTYKENARRKLRLMPGRLNLLFVGQHIWEKGLDVVVETLRLLKDRIPYTMNFIGTGYAADEIKSRIRDYGLDDRVFLHGVISDRDTLCDYYAASDLFLFPSFYDNAPLVVREAAAMGTPSVLLTGSTASEVISDRKNGFLTDKSPESFADLAEWLYRNPEQLHAAALGARSSLVRSWQDVVDEVADRYDTILKTYRKKPIH